MFTDKCRYDHFHICNFPIVFKSLTIFVGVGVWAKETQSKRNFVYLRYSYVFPYNMFVKTTSNVRVFLTSSDGLWTSYVGPKYQWPVTAKWRQADEFLPVWTKKIVCWNTFVSKEKKATLVCNESVTQLYRSLHCCILGVLVTFYLTRLLYI